LPPTFRIEFIKNRQIITFIADSLYYRTFPTAAYAELAWVLAICDKAFLQVILREPNAYDANVMS
jgi:hypothetical protein